MQPTDQRERLCQMIYAAFAAKFLDDREQSYNDSEHRSKVASWAYEAAESMTEKYYEARKRHDDKP